MRANAVAAAGLLAALAVAPAAVAASQAEVARTAALDAAAGWRDALEAHRAPQLPTPGDTESVILLLRDPPAADAPPGERADVARALRQRQEALEPVLASLGATVTFRYRVLLDAVAVRLPAGRLESLAALPSVRAVVPVGFLAPAQAAGARGEPTPAAGAGAPAVAGRAGRPAHIALIDAGIDPSHPWLGGGIGPTFPIIGGADLVDGDADPTAAAGDPAAEAHGTQMASLVLRSPALRDLPPERMPRLLAYRVVAPEPVGGRLRPLARTDRVLAALERAVNPDGDGATGDRAEVILLGLAAGFDGGGVDPLAQAVAAADRVGATVVAPAGNDGPTFARPGSVGGPAAAPTVIAVGGLSAGATPRTADLQAQLGPAAARLGPLPLMGPDPGEAAMRVAILRAPSGLATGDAPEHYRGDDGASLVEGALAVVGRGGGTIAEKAALAADAGAAALAVWDEAGPAGFPAVPGAGGLPLPVVGLGSSQGAALARLADEQPGLAVALAPRAVAEAPVGVASFSSWGPTADGRQKPDLVAPAVDRPAAWPGRGPGGVPLTAGLTGTSAAAADVAARALRLRVDRPGLGPRAVHSLLLQGATPVPGVAMARQGAGRVGGAADAALRLEPGIVSAARAPGGAATAAVTLADLRGRAGVYAVEMEAGGGRTSLREGVRIGAGRRARLRLKLPAARGRLVVRDAAGAVAATAPVLPARPATTREDALGRPQVRADGGLAEVMVQVGVLRRVNGRVHSTRLHGLRLTLVPADGGAPLPVAGHKQGAAWPAGTYRFLVARRLASGLEVPPGAYRLRVRAVGPDGARLTRESAPFTLD